MLFGMSKVVGNYFRDGKVLSTYILAVYCKVSHLE